MNVIEIDVTGIEERGVIAELPNNLKLDLIYNNYDNYIYLSIFINIYISISNNF